MIIFVCVGLVCINSGPQLRIYFASLFLITLRVFAGYSQGPVLDVTDFELVLPPLSWKRGDQLPAFNVREPRLNGRESCSQR